MIRTLIAGLFLAAAAIAFGDEDRPARPTPDQLAKLLGIDKGQVTIDEKPLNQRLQGKVHWLVTYHVSGEEDCSLIITLFPKDRIKTDFIAKAGKEKAHFRKIERKDGDVIYHSVGGRDGEGTFFMTTLINHEDDWDLTLILSREPGVDETKLPFEIEDDGSRLIVEIEALLRNEKAEQGGAHQPATRRASKPE